jgi:hypothetical protein
MQSQLRQSSHAEQKTYHQTYIKCAKRQKNGPGDIIARPA